MQKNYKIFQMPDVNITISKLPIWFEQHEFKGDINNGYIIFHSINDYDEIWGPNAKMELSWGKKSRMEYLHGKEVEESINIYNAINIVVTKKEQAWLNTHEFTFWYGRRTKMIRKRYYPENVIHGIFYCDLTERLFNIHTNVIKKHYEGFKSFIIETYKSIICH